MVDDYGPHQQILRDLKDFKHVGRADDQTAYERQWNLTCDGDPVNFVEYSCNISNAGSKTHVVLLEDWDPSKRNQIKPAHVNNDQSVW